MVLLMVTLKGKNLLPKGANSFLFLILFINGSFSISILFFNGSFNGYSYRKRFAPQGSKFFPLRVAPNEEGDGLRLTRKYIQSPLEQNK